MPGEHYGLQDHSVGDLYPLAPVGVGPEFWELHNLETGQVACVGPYTIRRRKVSGLIESYKRLEARDAVVWRDPKRLRHDHGTSTGRLSSPQPAFQELPKTLTVDVARLRQCVRDMLFVRGLKLGLGLGPGCFDPNDEPVTAGVPVIAFTEATVPETGWRLMAMHEID